MQFFLIESEIWPNTILEIKKRNIPLLLINARITKKNFLNWMKFSKVQKIYLKNLIFVYVKIMRQKNICVY